MRRAHGFSYDNGSKLLGESFRTRCEVSGVEICYIKHWRPHQNAYIELTNKSFSATRYCTRSPAVICPTNRTAITADVVSYQLNLVVWKCG